MHRIDRDRLDASSEAFAGAYDLADGGLDELVTGCGVLRFEKFGEVDELGVEDGRHDDPWFARGRSGG